jgi:hypothetical protein
MYKPNRIAGFGSTAAGPDDGPLIFSVTPADRTSKLLSFHDPEQHGGCPRFAVGTWVLGSSFGSRADGLQKRQTAIAAEGREVQMGRWSSFL